MKSTPRTMPRAQAQCTVWCRRNVPTFGNPARTKPTAWYRKVSRTVPSCTRMQDISPPTDHGIAGTAPPMCCGQPATKHIDPDGWYRRSVPAVGNPVRSAHEQPAHPPHGIAEKSTEATSVPPGVCGSGSLLAVWDPKLNMGTLSSHNHESHLECAAPGRSSQCGTRGVSDK